MEHIRSAASAHAANIKNRLASMAAIGAICLASGTAQAEFSFEFVGPASVNVGDVATFNLNVHYSPIDLTQFDDGSSGGSLPTASFAHGVASNTFQISVVDASGITQLPPTGVGTGNSDFDIDVPSITSFPFFVLFDVPGLALLGAEGITTETVNRFPTANCQVENGCSPDTIRDEIRFGGLTTASYSVNVTPVPEPETYAMLITGLGFLGAVARRRRKSA